MSDTNEQAVLRRIYASIIKGYSAASYKSQSVFVKHFSSIDQAELDESYLEYQKDALAQGLKSEADKLAEVKLAKLWSEHDENALVSHKSYLDNLFSTKKVQWLPSQIDEINKQIDEAQKTYRKKLTERNEVLGLTADKFASNKLNEVYIYRSLFKEKECITPFYDQETYDDFEKSEIYELIAFYNKVMDDCSETVIKKISISKFFQSAFQLCDNNIYYFFGKPISLLTFFQSSLVGYGQYFKSILTSNHGIPEDVLSDPDRLIDWVRGSQNAHTLINKTMTTGDEGGMASLVGAKDSDLVKLGLKKSSKSLQQLAREKGGSLTMEDMMAMSK